MTQVPEDASGTVDLTDACAILGCWLDGDLDALTDILRNADPGAILGQLVVLVVQFGRIITDGDDQQLRELINDALARTVDTGDGHG
ncbi:hypothetical protein M2302_001947 [Micromonospora sp. A200]|uniref:hypothetical protein n=1 Tax=Micromonospora sp. A200 TaxID=2940568 RepID=UPI00247372C5|nr:hypothetical protein [Micromonospora sp. A200]MDH6461772.1 hypothetical protein [Micromonospora sp. A200]